MMIQRERLNMSLLCLSQVWLSLSETVRPWHIHHTCMFVYFIATAMCVALEGFRLDLVLSQWRHRAAGYCTVLYCSLQCHWQLQWKVIFT